MIEFLAEHQLVLLFLVIAIGYPLGQVKIAGASLGVAAVLFVGLAVGALDARLQLPTIMFEFGLVTFMYTIGLTSGPGFFASLRGKGVRDNLFVLATLAMAASLTLAAGKLLGLKDTVTAGLFAGSLTNTPALAGVLDTIQRTAPAAQVQRVLSEPTIGYSVAYPMGVLGMILTLYFVQWRWRIDHLAEASRVEGIQTGLEKLINRTVHITRAEMVGVPLSRLVQERNWHVVFSRLRREGHVSLTSGETVLQLDDAITVVGAEDDVDAVVAALGQPSPEHLEYDRSEYDFRRIFVSRHAIIGRKLRDLELTKRFDAVVTRVRRGDVEFLPDGNTRLEPGDRVRVVTRPENMAAVSKFFGDSYRQLSEIDILSLGLGVALGMLLGLARIPMPGGGSFSLGLAGGPLIVAMILGTLGRTGPLVWHLPYSANLTIRQIALIFLLASIGLRSGYTFRTTFGNQGGLSLFLAGAAVTIFTAVVMLFVGYRIFKIPFGLLSGMLGGLGTQPATLGFAKDQAQNELPNVGYATVFPLATIAKIILAQLLLLLS